ncbi:MAG: trypsin-like peptidase domain-containing protein [Lachnospiraceae bacterium]|nr:trypsin-like peptidase domain-containing protein [Robinsoniella sp.]MDY3767963.1 trypsin-like peptidase domain-containing protein [Lachnospiraceae bacterium]
MKKSSLAFLLGIAVTGFSIGVPAAISSSAESAPAESIQADQEENRENTSFRIPTAQLVDTASQTGLYNNVADVAESAMPAIVAITNQSVQEVQSYFRGQKIQYESESCGSGIIIGQNETELLICTNNHVVEDATELTVSFIDETSCEAQIKGTDPTNDLAVVAVSLDDIDTDTLNQIKIAQMGDSDEVKIGEPVVAIGNALGYGQSVTTGIVSAKDRSITVEDDSQTICYENLIQTDAAINPGNSGGALLNMKGEVIGINSAKASSSGVEGMGYAIPVSKAWPILEKLMNKETRTQVTEEETPYIGIQGESVTAEAAQLYNLPNGIYITKVLKNTPAEQAGLQKGDIITGFDDNTITCMEDLEDWIQYYKGGETIEITVERAENGSYTEKNISITLGLKSDYMIQNA